jgi:hypothetical protein
MLLEKYKAFHFLSQTTFTLCGFLTSSSDLKVVFAVHITVFSSEFMIQSIISFIVSGSTSGSSH